MVKFKVLVKDKVACTSLLYDSEQRLLCVRGSLSAAGTCPCLPELGGAHVVLRAFSQTEQPIRAHVTLGPSINYWKARKNVTSPRTRTLHLCDFCVSTRLETTTTPVDLWSSNFNQRSLPALIQHTHSRRTWSDLLESLQSARGTGLMMMMMMMKCCKATWRV